MKVTHILLSGGALAALVMSAPQAQAGTLHECAAGKPTAESYTWNFKGEANQIFQDVELDARQVMDHADHIKSISMDTYVSRADHADALDTMKVEINDMGAKLCRLETIRMAVAPWQQAEIDRIATAVRLMADNTEAAIHFLNAHQQWTWRATYRKYADNLYSQARSLVNSTRDAVTYAKVSHEDRTLRQRLGIRKSS